MLSGLGDNYYVIVSMRLNHLRPRRLLIMQWLHSRNLLGRYEQTINKLTPLVGTLGPDKHKREDNQIEAILYDQRPAYMTSTKLILASGTIGQEYKCPKRESGTRTSRRT